MTIEKVMELLATAEDLDAALLEDCEEKEIAVTVLDFGGFDDNWSEIMLDYDEDKVNEIYEILSKKCKSMEDDFYTDFHFDGFYVHWGYASFEI